VVWFGEALPEAELMAAEAAAESCDLMLVVGTSGEVYPAAGLAYQAQRAGARLVIVNPQPSALDALAGAKVRERAARCLPFLMED